MTFEHVGKLDDIMLAPLGAQMPVVTRSYVCREYMACSEPAQAVPRSGVSGSSGRGVARSATRARNLLVNVREHTVSPAIRTKADDALDNVDGLKQGV